jgi:hypothetical protein
MTDPIRHIAQPILPKSPNCSSKKYEPSTAPMRTESAPRGVTRMAGAKAYAAKLNISPSTTVCRQSHTHRTVSRAHALVVMPAHHTGFCRYPKPSPLKPCFSIEALRPFFVMTKLAPMASDELTASMSPTYLSLSSVPQGSCAVRRSWAQRTCLRPYWRVV